MARKVTTAVFDNDLRCKIGKYEVSEDGTKIRIKSGGEAHFMPTFDNDSFLEFPSWKKYLFFGERTYKRVYIVMNKAKECVNFRTDSWDGPDLEQLKNSIAATSLDKLGQPQPHFPSWMIYLILGLTFIMTLKLFGAI